MGLGALGPSQKAFKSITQIGVLSSLVLTGFDPLWPNLIFACEATFSSPIRRMSSHWDELRVEHLSSQEIEALALVSGRGFLFWPPQLAASFIPLPRCAERRTSAIPSPRITARVVSGRSPSAPQMRILEYEEDKRSSA